MCCLCIQAHSVAVCSCDSCCVCSNGTWCVHDRPARCSCHIAANRHIRPCCRIHGAQNRSRFQSINRTKPQAKRLILDGMWWASNPQIRKS